MRFVLLISQHHSQQTLYNVSAYFYETFFFLFLYVLSTSNTNSILTNRRIADYLTVRQHHLSYETHLARQAAAQRTRSGGLYVLLPFLIYLFIFRTISVRPIVSKSTQPIFARFLVGN